MKSKIFSLFIFAFLIILSDLKSQSLFEVIREPSNSFGYIVWAADTSKVSYVRYEFAKHNIHIGPASTEVLSRGEIWGKNYLFVPRNYRHPSDGNNYAYTLLLQAYDNQHQPIPGGEIPTMVGGSGEELCYWNCVSSDYAYRIQATRIGGDGYPTSYTYSIKHAFAAIDEEGYEVPFYRYFSPDEFALHTGLRLHSSWTELQPGNGNPNWHDLWDWPYYIDKLNANQILAIPNSQSIEYFSSTGMNIDTELVYGVQKGRGPWFGAQIYSSGHTVNKCEEPMGEVFHLMMNWMDSVAIPTDSLGPLVPYLHCHADQSNGGYYEVGNPGSAGGSDCGNYFTYNSPSDPVFVTPLLDPTELWAYFLTTVTTGFQCDSITTLGDPNVTFTNLLSSSEFFHMVQYKNTGPTQTMYKHGKDFLNADGSPNMPAFTLDEGLHKITLKQPGKILQYIFLEVLSPFTGQIAHKDFFDVVIYPNPNSAHHYFANVTTTAALRGTYEVFDGIGNRRYFQDFDLPKDHSGNHKITPAVPLPTGFLYHKFTFADGSHKTVTTIQQ